MPICVKVLSALYPTGIAPLIEHRFFRGSTVQQGGCTRDEHGPFISCLFPDAWDLMLQSVIPANAGIQCAAGVEGIRRLPGEWQNIVSGDSPGYGKISYPAPPLGNGKISYPATSRDMATYRRLGRADRRLNFGAPASLIQRQDSMLGKEKAKPNMPG